MSSASSSASTTHAKTDIAAYLERIEKRDIILGVLGMGYVGLPFAVQFADVGFPVIGFDVWEEKIKQREAGSGAGSDVTDEHLAETIANKQISFTTDFSQLSKCQCIVICVPTPLSKFRTPDLSYIVSAMDEVVKHLQPDTMIVLESTTYPGCTDELISRRVEKDSGLVVGDNVFVSFSPERVDPGNKDFDLRYTPKVMGGATPNCWTVTSAMYKTVVQNLVGVDSTKEAELVKLLENTFRAVNIGMVNELAHMADRMGVNIWNVINAAKSKPFGFMAFYPGPGIGGHCIPLDPQYLSYTAKTYNHYSRFIELASDVNENMPEFCVNKCMRMLNTQGKAMRGAKVMIMGVAYKKNVSDCRESPSQYLWKYLSDLGADVCFNDPHVDTYTLGHGADAPQLKNTPLTKEAVAEQDLILISTDHDAVDWPMVAAEASLIFDARNAMGSRDLLTPELKAKLTPL